MTELLDVAAAAAVRPRRSALRWIVLVGVLAIGLVAFVLFWFQPQKLIIDDKVHEPAPTAAPLATSAATSSSAPAAPVELARGDFVSRDHGTTGTARVLELPGESRVLRIEGLDTSNGPDVYVYLTANRASGEEQAFDDEYVSLGRLKGNVGDQNYEVPPGTDLDHFGTVVLWCDRFNSAFGAADLSSA
jgi:hypothetical protein